MLAAHVSVRRGGAGHSTVTLKVRYGDFETITRSLSRLPETRSRDELSARAVSLLQRTDAGGRPVRLLGVSVHGFLADDDATAQPPPSPQLTLNES